MKRFWLDARKWNRNAVTTALESGADAIFVLEEDVDKVKELGLIQTIAENGDIKIGEDVVELVVNSKEDEAEVIKQGLPEWS